MPIDDILRERGEMPTPEQQQAQQEQQQAQSQSRPGTLQVEIPEFSVQDQDALLFYLNVLQTLAIIYLLVRG